MSYLLFSQNKGFFNYKTHNWTPHIDAASTLNERQVTMLSSSIDVNCSFVEASSVQNLSFENVIEIVGSKVAEMSSYDMADAFNAATFSDIEYDDESDAFILDGEEISHYELISNLKEHLKFETPQDVMEIYEQICKTKVFYFCDSETYIHKS